MIAEKRQYFQLLIWIMVLLFIGSLSGSMTNDSIKTWYLTLNRSPLTPPNYVFGIVWSLLYTMIAISGWLIWQAQSLAELTLAKRLYVLQLLLNWSWTPLFFGYQLTGAALICLTCTIIVVATLIIKIYQNLKVASVLLIPYLLWLLLAGHLNFYIWLYN